MGEKQKRPVAVLIVEDEPLVLMNAVELVIEAGFEAIWAKNADDAIIILERREDVRVIFTDIICLVRWMAGTCSRRAQALASN